MKSEFRINYSGHERNARKLLVEDEIISVTDAAYLTSADVVNLMNKYYTVISSCEDYVLIRNADYARIKDLFIDLKR